MKRLIFIFVLLTLESCNKSNKQNTSTNLDETKKESALFANSKPTDTDKSVISKVEFLNYIDESLVFQEAIENENLAYAFVCHGDEKQMLFSGKIYLKPQNKDLSNWKDDKYRTSILDSINHSYSTAEIHKRFSMWVQITYKEYFMPYEDWIDNPCEYYKEEREVVIYKSEIEQKNWIEIEKTKDLERIKNLLK